MFHLADLKAQLALEKSDKLNLKDKVGKLSSKLIEGRSKYD